MAGDTISTYFAAYIVNLASGANPPLAEIHGCNTELPFRFILWINVSVNRMLCQFRAQRLLEILVLLALYFETTP